MRPTPVKDAVVQLVKLPLGPEDEPGRLLVGVTSSSRTRSGWGCVQALGASPQVRTFVWVGLTDLTSEAAAHGTHLYQSLGVLFRLVNDGFPAGSDAGDGSSDDRGGLRFEALRADLFAPDATALIDRVGLGNGCLQDVLGRLLLSRKQKGRDRGFVSYAQLGINQLGAVYEGLMSYTGLIAETHMVEVARDGDPAKGSWVVPQSATAGFEERWFVTSIDPQTGDRRR